jgi:hypothetical protein
VLFKYPYVCFLTGSSVPARYLTAKPVEVYLISVPVGVPLPSISGSL